MSISVECPECEYQAVISHEFANRNLVCPACKQSFTPLDIRSANKPNWTLGTFYFTRWEVAVGVAVMAIACGVMLDYFSYLEGGQKKHEFGGQAQPATPAKNRPDQPAGY